MCMCLCVWLVGCYVERAPPTTSVEERKWNKRRTTMLYWQCAATALYVCSCAVRLYIDRYTLSVFLCVSVVRQCCAYISQHCWRSVRLSRSLSDFHQYSSCIVGVWAVCLLVCVYASTIVLPVWMHWTASATYDAILFIIHSISTCLAFKTCCCAYNIRLLFHSGIVIVRLSIHGCGYIYRFRCSTTHNKTTLTCLSVPVFFFSSSRMHSGMPTDHSLYSTLYCTSSA